MPIIGFILLAGLSLHVILGAYRRWWIERFNLVQDRLILSTLSRLLLLLKICIFCPSWAAGDQVQLFMRTKKPYTICNPRKKWPAPELTMGLHNLLSAALINLPFVRADKGRIHWFIRPPWHAYISTAAMAPTRSPKLFCSVRILVETRIICRQLIACHPHRLKTLSVPIPTKLWYKLNNGVQGSIMWGAGRRWRCDHGRTFTTRKNISLY